jgi:hypothetical protein
MKMKQLIVALALALITAGSVLYAADPAPAYTNNFEKLAVGSTPQDFLVIDGGFTVKEEAGNKLLELPGSPLDSFGALFGSTEKEGVVASARIMAISKGRRFPTFGIGLNGVAGYKLQASPAKKLLELTRGDVVKATAPLEWTSGKWTFFKLQSTKGDDGKWLVQGRIWSEGQPEPQTWAISFTDAEEPPAGRSSIWGSPFATTPIQYDDLAASRIK